MDCDKMNLGADESKGIGSSQSGVERLLGRDSLLAIGCCLFRCLYSNSVRALGEQALLARQKTRADQAIDRVGCGALAAVIVAHLQLAEQTDGPATGCRPR